MTLFLIHRWLIVLISLLGAEHISGPKFDPQTRTKSPAPELSVPERSPAPPKEPDKQQIDAETSTETEDAAETPSDENIAAQLDEELDREQDETREQEQSAEEVADVRVVRETEVDVVLEKASEKVRPAGRDVEESLLLSEKERQNEEMNEKDNCSASSISSTSSTLEREEREEKITNDMKAGAAEA